MADINKIGLLVIEDGRMLLVRKQGLEALILPGGKIEGSETAEDCLRREIHEELGENADVDAIAFVDDYEDVAASDDPSVHKTLKISLYQGKLIGDPQASSEIVEFVWLDGSASRIEELAYQRWDGERIAQETFFYDPVQLKPKAAG